MKTILFLFMALALASCATPRQPIIGPDGTENYIVSCGSVELCYKYARNTCEGNYQIVNTTTRTVGDYGTVRSVIRMLIKCENAPKTESSSSPSEQK